MSKLIKTSVEHLTRSLDTPGLMRCDYTYKVTEAKGEMTYTGPKINPAEWAEVLAFFRWVNDTSHSEAQVRMFFDPEANRVFFYAFPQAKNTGMTTRELDTEESRAQRSALPNSANLVNVGTVHSHCSASAFQSGTDEANEVGQDGIHITIGHLDKPTFSIHARFYRKRDLFDPDLSKFWDIGDSLASLPSEIIAMLPPDAEDKMARGQMTKSPPEDQAFPEQWRLNIVEPPKEHPHWYHERPIQHFWKDGEFRWAGSDRYQRQGEDWVYTPSSMDNTYVSKHTQPAFSGTGSSIPNPPVDKSNTKRRKQKGKDLDPLPNRVAQAFKELIDSASVYGYEAHDIEDTLDEACTSELAKTVIQVCKDYDIVPDDLQQAFGEWKHDETQKALADMQRQDGEGGMHNGWGFGYGG